MITTIDFALMTPAVYAIANKNDVDLSVGRSMLLNNIRHGREIDGMKELPDEFTPDYAALHELYAADPGAVVDAFNEAAIASRDCYKELVEAWNANQYDRMVGLVDAAIDANNAEEEA